MSEPGDKKPLGRILLQQKLVSPEELSRVLEEQKQSPGGRLASSLAASGKLSDLELLRALSDQLGVPAIDLTQVVIPLTNLKLVPIDVAKQYAILPFSQKDDEMWLAMADPHERRIIDEIEFVTAKRVAPYVALHDQLVQVIDAAYRDLERGEAYYVGPRAPADYLASLGIAPRPPAQPPPPPPRAPTREKAPPPRDASLDETDFSSLLGDEPKAPEASSPRGPSSLGVPSPAGIPGRGDPRAPSRHGEVTPRGPTRADPREPARHPQAKDNPKEIGDLDPAFGSRVGPLPTRDPRGPNADGVPRTVLVVDDEEDIRRLLRRILQERGYRVLEAARGGEALQAIRENAIDCIVLDAMLPEIHGFDICQRIKASQRYGHLPIIMVSAIYRGWRFAEDLRESFGVTAFLEKPFKISDVLLAVERAIEGKPFETADPEEAIGPEAQAALERGMAAYHRGDIDGAIVEMTKGLAIEPNSFRLHFHLGLLYGRRDNLFEAIQEIETALGVSSRNFAALKNLAVLYQRAGFKHKAVESWERALRSAPDEPTRLGIKEHLMGLL